MIFLRLLNLFLLLSLVGCLAGAMAGLIVFAPFVGGAWFLTLIAITGSDGGPTQAARRRQVMPAPCAKPTAAAAPSAANEPITSSRARGRRSTSAASARKSGKSASRNRGRLSSG